MLLIIKIEKTSDKIVTCLLQLNRANVIVQI